MLYGGTYYQLGDLAETLKATNALAMYNKVSLRCAPLQLLRGLLFTELPLYITQASPCVVQAFALLLRDPNGLRKMATTIASARPRPSQATRYLKAVLELFPDDVAVMNQLAAFAIDDERWDDAESYLKGALEAEPDLPDSYFNLGRVAQMRLEAQEASKASGGAADTRAVKPEEIKMWYEGALQRDPTHDKAMLYYGRYALNDVVGVVSGGGDLAVCDTQCWRL